MTRTLRIPSHDRSYPSKPPRSIAEQAMFLSLSAETGRLCPVQIEPRKMDEVIAAALALDLAEFGEEN